MFYFNSICSNVKWRIIIGTTRLLQPQGDIGGPRGEVSGHLSRRGSDSMDPMREFYGCGSRNGAPHDESIGGGFTWHRRGSWVPPQCQTPRVEEDGVRKERMDSERLVPQGKRRVERPGLG